MRRPSWCAGAMEAEGAACRWVARLQRWSAQEGEPKEGGGMDGTRRIVAGHCPLRVVQMEDKFGGVCRRTPWQEAQA